MARPSIIGTTWQDAWGTAGTQSLKPVPHIEGLGSWAGRMDDRMCFMAGQQTDTVFTTDMNELWSFGVTLARTAAYACYYNGQHSHFVFGFDHFPLAGIPESCGTYSVRFGGIDFGTVTVNTLATTVEWYANIPPSLAAGEHMFEIYGAAHSAWYAFIRARAFWLAFIPGRF